MIAIEQVRALAGGFSATAQSLKSIVRMIVRDPLRPSFLCLLPYILLILASRVLAAVALALLPVAIFSEHLAGGFLGAGLRWLQEAMPAGARVIDIHVLAAILSPLLYAAHGVATYVAQREFLFSSIAYQKRLSRRALETFMSPAGQGKEAGITAGEMRRLVVGDARYLGRAFLGLLTAIPDLMVGLLMAVLLIVVVPKPVFWFVIAFLLVLPWQLSIAARGRERSNGYLSGAARFSKHLTEVCSARQKLIISDDREAARLEETALGAESQDYFDMFQDRSRMGLLTALAGQISFALMILVLIGLHATSQLTNVVGSAETGILIVVAARYLFSGISGASRAIIGLSMTHPYYSGYLDYYGGVMDPQKGSGGAFSRRRSDGDAKSSPAAVSVPALPVEEQQLVGNDMFQTTIVVNTISGPRHVQVTKHLGIAARATDVDWATIARLLDLPGMQTVLIGDKQALVSAGLFGTAIGRRIVSSALANCDFKKLIANNTALAELLIPLGPLVEEAIRTPEALSGTAGGDALLIALSIALDRRSSPIFVAEREFRLLNEAKRALLIRALEGCQIVTLQTDRSAIVILPAPPHRLLVTNEGILDIVDGRIALSELPRHVVDLTFERPFGAVKDKTIVMSQEDLEL